jgi:hypothetical protein
MPARRERPRLGLTVADDARHEQIGVVERRSERVRERVAKLAALVDRPGDFGCGVAGNAAWKGELATELPQPLLVAAHVGIQLAVRAFEVRVRDHSGQGRPRRSRRDRARGSPG